MAMKLVFPDNSTFQVMMDTNLRSGMFLINCQGEDTQFQVLHPAEDSPYILQITHGETQVSIGMSEAQYAALDAAVNDLEYGSVGIGGVFGDK